MTTAGCQLCDAPVARSCGPVYRETHLDDREMEPIRQALDEILASHEPFPAVVVYRHSDLVTANAAALAILGDRVVRELLLPPVNALRVSLHPDGLAPRIENFGEWAAHLLQRLDRQISNSGRSEAPCPCRRTPVLSRGRCAGGSRRRRGAPVRPAGYPRQPRVAPVLQHRGHVRHCPGHHYRRAGRRVVLSCRRVESRGPRRGMSLQLPLSGGGLKGVGQT